MSTNRNYLPPALREEAFDLFVAGYSRRRLCAELRARYGAEAPSEATLRNWSRSCGWMDRRARIRGILRHRADTLRALAGPDLTAALHKLRSLVVDAVAETPFHSAEGALFSLAALERVIARHEDREAERALEEHRRSIRAPLTLLETGNPEGPDDQPSDDVPEVSPSFPSPSGLSRGSPAEGGGRKRGEGSRLWRGGEVAQSPMEGTYPSPRGVR